MSNTPTVLVIDDDEGIVLFIEMALNDEGYQVLSAVNGAALLIARERHPDLILLDMMMPIMDGVEVSRRLRADPETASIPIIAMSALDNLHGIGARILADDRLPKPFDLYMLYAIVRRWTATV